MKPSCSRTRYVLLGKLGIRTHLDLIHAHPTGVSVPTHPHHMWHMPLGMAHVWGGGRPTRSRTTPKLGPIYGPDLGERGAGSRGGYGLPWVASRSVLLLLGVHKEADHIRVMTGALFSRNRIYIQGHNNKFLREQGSHPRLKFLLQHRASFSFPESKLFLLEDFSRGRRRPHVSTRSGSTQQKTSRFIKVDLLHLLLDLCSSNKDHNFIHRPSLQGLRR